MDTDTITGSTFTQAKRNLHHTTFIEMNQKVVVDVMIISSYTKVCVMDIDGSKILLPDSSEIIEKFGEISYLKTRLKLENFSGKTAELVYQVLNNIFNWTGISFNNRYL
ncbi:MAG: hypothetical protein QM487_08680 [Candidatus Marithrix sp.]